jgi:type I restriction enzyme R subunit
MGEFTESVVEEAALGWLESLGYKIAHGPDIASGELLAERKHEAKVPSTQRACRMQRAP